METNLLGKQISESAYVSPLQLREAYTRVLEHIQLGILRSPEIRPEEIQMLKKILKLAKEGKIKISV
jgi:hypothetical protein